MNDRAKILFFATLRDKTGIRETNIEFPRGSRVSDIKNMLVNAYPALKSSMDTLIVALNHEYAFDENIVQDGAEIALFPPVSGGQMDKVKFPTYIEIVDLEIDINGILEKVTTSHTGAASIFTGIVRGETTRGMLRQTLKLEYEAYIQMAETKMHQISDEIRSRWQDVEGIAIVQRTGVLLPGTISVIIICASSHRDSGIFEAAHYGIDRLKEVVPIWKKEISQDGEEWIEGEYIPQKGD